MKKRLWSKPVSLLLAALMLLSLLPAAAFAAPGGASIMLSYQKDDGGFVLARHPITVEPGLSEEYGYLDAYCGTAVTALDALVAAHIEVFGDDPEVIAANFGISGGWVNNFMGGGNGNFVFLVNGKLSDLSADFIRIKDGDLVELFSIQDTDMWGDAYAWFEFNGARVGELSVGTDVGFTLTLKGVNFVVYGDYGAFLSEIEGAMIYQMSYFGDPLGGASMDTPLGLTDDDGEITLTFDSPGVYYLSAVDYDSDWELPLMSPWLIVTVTAGDDPAEAVASDISNPPPVPEAPGPPSADAQTAYEATLAYIAEKLAPAPVFGDEWEIMTLARAGYGVPAGYYESYYKTVEEKLEATGDGKLDIDSSITNARLILALTAIGVDATDVGGYDLIAPLMDFGYTTYSGINGAAYALLALDAKPYAAAPGVRDDLVDYILGYELPGGGFNWGWGDDLEPDMTGMALQALAPYRSGPEVMAAVARALDALSARQAEGGGYKSSDSVWLGVVYPGAIGPENMAQVIVAAAALGLDPTENPSFVKEGNPLSSMLSFYVSGGGFATSGALGMVNRMATQQAAYALTAYSRFADGDNPLYDMSDCAVSFVPLTEVSRDLLSGFIAKGEALTESSYTAVSWQYMRGKLTAARAVYLDAGATQTMINTAAAELNTAINALRPAGGSGADEPFVVYVTLQGLNSASGEVETWLNRQAVYSLEEGSTAGDAVERALEEAGYRQEGAKSGYVISVTTPGGFTLDDSYNHLPYAGWLFLINSAMPMTGMDVLPLKSGDSILLYFTKDFTKDPYGSQFSGEDFYAKDGDQSTVSSSLAVSAAVAGQTAVAIVDSAMIADALQEALDKLGESGAGAMAEVKINVTGIAGATSVKVQIQAESLGTIAAANDGKAQLTIESGIAALTLDAKALAGLAQGAAAGATVEFLMEYVDAAALDDDIRQIVGDNPVFNLAVSVGGAEIHQFNGTVTVTLPYDPPAGTDPATLTVYWLDASGNPVPAENVHYDALRKEFTFTTTHFSLFFIGGIDAEEVDPDWINPFADVRRGDWFYDVVKYAYSNGLMTGTSTSPMLFSPNMTLTRGMAVTILHRMAGSPDERIPAAAGGGQFMDVAEDAYYSQAVNWAAANGVVAGYGEGLFGPEDDITREQMAAILLNYELYAAKIPNDILADRSFSDWGAISDWAKNAVNRLTMQGLLSGKPGNRFDPAGKATRAEFAAIITRYLENVKG